jgi:hypothetical protein
MAMSPRLLRPRATGFNPKSISGLKLWLDATDATTITLNGSSVSEWRDKSGNAFHFSQGTSNNQPSYTGTINGKAAIVFDGTNDGLDRLSVTNSTVADATGACAFLVYEVSGTDTQYAAFRTLTNGSGHDRFNSTTFHSYFRTSRFASLTPAPPSSGKVLLTSSSDVSADTQTLRINGSASITQACATTFAAWRALSGGLATWAIGYDASYLAGSVGEVIVVGRAVAATEIATVEKYLARKWGVTLA